MKSAHRGVILALIAFLLLTSFTQVKAADQADIDGQVADDQSSMEGEQDKLAAEAAAQLAKEERKRAAQQKKRTMESCLTLVRSYYGAEETIVSSFVEEHPTLDKSRLLNKILSQMMIRCNKDISEEQIAYLQDYKMNPLDMTYTMSGYPELIELDWEALKHVPADPENLVEGEGSGPVEMTS